MNHYAVIGVAPESDTAAIKRAYLDAARRHHPDFHAGADAATRSANAGRMTALNEAWAVLGDPGARASYDRSLRIGADPGVQRRASREPAMPDGKGWTPRADDDGWMTDFEAWADERDDLVPDPPRSTGRKLVTILPVGLFGLAIGATFVGMAVQLRELVAVGVICVIVALGLFLLLPMFEMSRGRRR